MFENAASGRVMDVRSASMANGALLQTWAANDTEAQSFYLTATELVSDGMYEISCAADGRLLDVSSGSFFPMALTFSCGRGTTLVLRNGMSGRRLTGVLPSTT